MPFVPAPQLGLAGRSNSSSGFTSKVRATQSENMFSTWANSLWNFPWLELFEYIFASLATFAFWNFYKLDGEIFKTIQKWWLIL